MIKQINRFDEGAIGDEVIIYAFIKNLQKRVNNNSSYYFVTLFDGTKNIDARVWDCKIIDDNDVTSGDVYMIAATITEYSKKPQFVISSIKKVDDSFDRSRFIATAPMSKDELIAGIKMYIKQVENPVCLKVLKNIFNKISGKFFEYPAAMSMHHDYLYGLAYHTYTMLRHAEHLYNVYPGMNKSLLYSGVLLHDIGKTEELSSKLNPTYSLDGQLLGHIVIGLDMISVAASEEGVLDSEEVKLLLHMEASHHGELEYGSPKEPMIMEAYALHLIDLLDAKMAAISPAVLATKAGEMTPPIGSINRKSIYVPKIK